MFQKIHDISQEFFTARVYPGDTAPRHRPVAATSARDVCNVAAIEMGDHNGIHIDAARRLNHYGVKLVGCESQSVAPVSAPAPVHIELLGHEVVILEGLSLDGVADGEYFLCAAPLLFGGLSGAPCRVLLLE